MSATSDTLVGIEGSLIAYNVTGQGPLVVLSARHRRR